MPFWVWGFIAAFIWIGVVIGIGLALRRKDERRAEELWQEAFQDELEYRKKLGALKKRLDRRKGEGTDGVEKL